MSPAADHDVVVCGLGAVGAAAAWQLARRDRRVLGLDRFRPPHARGSSHGGTRIIREAYFEHPLYVPLVRRAYDAWREIERRTGRTLLHETGGLTLGLPDAGAAHEAYASARRHGVPHERLSAAEVRRRFPALRPADGHMGVYEPRAGYLLPEPCVEAQLGLAREAGAELRFDEPVERWEADDDGVSVTTPRGSYRARRLVLAAGPWTAALVPDLALPLAVERVVVCWFSARARARQFRPDRLPVWVYEYAPNRIAYGVPDTGDGLKAGLHHQGDTTDAETVPRDVGERETERVREALRGFMPDALGRLRRAEVCLYTNTPDHHFIIDRHPAHPRVVLLAGFSGHGFKFSAVIGELAARLAGDQNLGFDLEPFRMDRFM